MKFFNNRNLRGVSWVGRGAIHYALPRASVV